MLKDKYWEDFRQSHSAGKQPRKSPLKLEKRLSLAKKNQTMPKMPKFFTLEKRFLS